MMDKLIRRRGHFIQCDIAGTPYLLPFGQNIADFSRGLRCNETSAFLWELLAEGRTFQELLQLCAAAYHVPADSLPELTADLRRFLEELDRRDMLESTVRPSPPPPGSGDQYLAIGGLVLRLCGYRELCHSAFAPFRLPAPQTPCQTVQIVCSPPRRHENGALLLRNEELVVIELPAYYVLLFPASPGVVEIHLQKDGALVTCFCRPETAGVEESLFHALRLPYLYLAQRRGMAAIHSASLLYRQRAWLFSGPSGTGKSTHTELWRRLYGVPLLNGDLNLIALRDGVPVVHGLPWCGTSGISTPETHVLGGVFLLRQAGENRVEPLPAHQRRLLTAQRFISPTWTAEQLLANLDVSAALEPRLLICRLLCTPDPAAAETARAAVDSYLDAAI